jgi:hypothetical protein
MRGIPYYNFPAFGDAHIDWLRAGWDVVDPAQMDINAGFNAYALPPDTDWNAIPADFDFNACVDRDIAGLRTCQAIYMLDGWQGSSGARAELALAEWLGLDVVYQSEPQAHETKYVQATNNDTGETSWVRVTYCKASTPPDATPAPDPAAPHRTFATGATRDTDTGKLDFDGFLSGPVLVEFAKYMHENRKMRDGSLRDSDNWQKGIPREQYRKSAFRHFMEWWQAHRAGRDTTRPAMARFGTLMMRGWPLSSKNTFTLPSSSVAPASASPSSSHRLVPPRSRMVST